MVIESPFVPFSKAWSLTNISLSSNSFAPVVGPVINKVSPNDKSYASILNSPILPPVNNALEAVISPIEPLITNLLFSSLNETPSISNPPIFPPSKNTFEPVI